MKRLKNCISILLCITFVLTAMCMSVRADAPPASYAPLASYREHLSESEQAADSTERLYKLEEYIDLRAKLKKNKAPSPIKYIVIAAAVILAFLAVNAVGAAVCLIVLGYRSHKKRKANAGK